MSSTRAAWRTAFVDVLKATPELAEVPASLAWPGDQAEAETIWLEPPAGIVTVPYFHGTPNSSNELTYRDTYRVGVQIRCAKTAQTEDEVETRITDIRDAVVKVQRDDPTFAVDGVLFSTLAEENGPATGRSESVGVVSFLQLVFEVLAQEG